MAAIDILRDILAKRKKPDQVQAEPSTLGTVSDLRPRQPEILTLGGTRDMAVADPFAANPRNDLVYRQPTSVMPVASPMATRPRIVPDAPVRDYTVNPMMQPGYSDDDTRMGENLMATRPGAPQPAAPVDYSDPRQRIKAIENKDYSLIKDADGNVVHRGKDRDKKWGLGEKVGSFIMGMFDGTGAIPAAMDRNYMEKRQDRRDLADAYGSVQRQQKMERADLENQQQAAQNDYLAVRPQLEQQKIDNAAEAKQREFDLKSRTQNFKESDRVEYYRLEREKLQALQENRADLYELAVRRQTEIERNNKVNNSLRERQVAVQEGRAQMAARKAAEGGTSRGSGSKPAAKKGLTGAQQQQFYKLAQKLDEDFNSGLLSEEAYNNMIGALTQRIQQQ